jgi:hypothetical protein
MAKPKSFKAEYGASVEVRGAWHKLSCSLEVDYEDGDNAAEVRERVWNTVYNEIERQLKDIIGN